MITSRMATEALPGENLYEQVESYDWVNDQEFQGGLKAILGSATSPEQVAHLSLRARCFYYSRKFGTKVDFDGYQAWRNAQSVVSNGDSTVTDAPAGADHTTVAESETDAAPAAHGNAPTPASFAEICQLIAEGKPIPGIKEIPDTVLEGSATAATKPKRRKPWEKDTPSVEGQSGETGVQSPA
ncbi:hypothetical protein BDZ85DRAFT_17717 [Elsinoe ampelina]|uniref:Uncharacterized protein n=1 Tax=Elsinoe ampelina TaxID=302913 RepID=A0A6A6G7F9_9PEZI|nr:hypothetical protein BDZ85DRAFT_17717 [Elsinoe ampelina]